MEVKDIAIRVKEEFKQTEVGLIPADWKVVELKQLAEKIMVGIASSATHAYRETGVVLFRNQNIKPNYLDDSDIIYITPEYEQLFKNKRLYEGDLLTARTGYPGTTCKVPSTYIGAQSFTTLITRLKTSNVDVDFLCFYINSTTGQLFFEQNQIGGGQKNVNAGTLKTMPAPLPPTKAEQTAIATVLSDTDALISRLETLIEKKRAIKQGAMQQLLKPKEDWVVKKLGEVGVFSKGQGIRKDESLSGEIPCIRYGELYTVHDDYIKRFFSFISQKVAQTSKKVKEGDILFAGSGETKEEIGKAVAFIEKTEAYAGGDIVILSPTNTNSKFLGYLLNTPFVTKQKASRGQGDAVVHISANSLADIIINLPSLEEQSRIAQILSDMDAEIAGLEQKLAKYKLVKQGMMQELLTGKTRLV